MVRADTSAQIAVDRSSAVGGQVPGRVAGTYDLLVSTRLETARLIVRTFQARDAGPWLAMVTDPEVRRFLPAGPAPTIELAQRIIGERQAMERELGHTMWAVEDKTTGTFVGQCGRRPGDEGAGPEIDLAYHYSRASWNKGYATEAAIAVIGHGLGPVGLATIMAVVVPENIGSWRVMEKAGMRYQGLVDYYGMEGLKKYVAAREWWRSPVAS
jgi:RimJ/RimL family protein N-acetyltransferase